MPLPLLFPVKAPLTACPDAVVVSWAAVYIGGNRLIGALAAVYKSPCYAFILIDYQPI